MRRRWWWWWCAALWPLWAWPVAAQDTAVQRGVDGLRLAMESAGLLVSHGDLAGAPQGVIPELRVFSAKTDPIHRDIRFPAVSFTSGEAGWSFRLPDTFGVSVRWGLDAAPWLIEVKTQGAVFELVKGADGAFNGASLKAQTLTATSAPSSPGVFVATINGLEFRNTEVGESGFDERWAWDDGALRAAFDVPGEGRLQLDVESVDVERVRKGEAYGWIESLPWMAAIDHGMVVEESWSLGRTRVEAATTSGLGIVESDAVAVARADASWRHARSGVTAQAEAEGLEWEMNRAGAGLGFQSPAATVALRLPTHPDAAAQGWSLVAAGAGTAFHGAASLPLSWDIKAEGSAVMARPIFARVGNDWQWLSVLAALDGVDARLDSSSLTLTKESLRAEGTASLAPSGVRADLALDGFGAGWASSVAVWGGWPLLAEILANPALTEALAGPEARKVGWSGQGLVVEPVAP